MKKLFKPFKTMLPLLFLLPLGAVAQGDHDEDKEKKEKYEFVKTKSFSKSYNVSSNDKLDIHNSFGSVKIETWTKNEIKVDVSIEASSNVESVAQKIIDRISISESQNSGNVTIKTNIRNMDNDSKGNQKTSMHINYVVYMPAGNPLKLSNEFGTTTVPDMRGEVELISKFGKLNAGVLTKVKSILVEFGKATIAAITDADVTSKYSSIILGKMSGNIKMNVEFSGKVQLNYGSSLTGLDLKASYSSVNLRPAGDPSVSYNISTSFGSVKNRTGIKLTSDEDDDNDSHSPKFDHEYSGKSGSGSIPVKVKSSFSSIVLGEPSADDMKEKNKNKNKSRTS